MKKAGRLAGEAGVPRPGKESPTGEGGAGREGFPFLLLFAASEREALIPEGGGAGGLACEKCTIGRRTTWKAVRL